MTDLLKRAKEIQDAFGPCTGIYECWETSEIAEELEKRGEKSVVEVQLMVMEINAERHAEAAYQQEASGESHYEGSHQKAIQEDNLWHSEIVARLRAIGAKGV